MKTYFFENSEEESEEYKKELDKTEWYTLYWKDGSTEAYLYENLEEKTKFQFEDIKKAVDYAQKNMDKKFRHLDDDTTNIFCKKVQSYDRLMMFCIYNLGKEIQENGSKHAIEDLIMSILNKHLVSNF